MGQTIGKQWTAKSEAYTTDVHCIQVIRKYGGSKTWVIGVAVDIAGALLMLKAVSQAPVSECMSLCNVKCSCKQLSCIYYLQLFMWTTAEDHDARLWLVGHVICIYQTNISFV